MLKQIVNDSALTGFIRNVKRKMPHVDFLGEGVVINGTYTSNKNVIVDGSVEGNIYVNGYLTIEETGIVNGNVFAENIDISGVVRGNLRSKNKMTIRASAVISGDLYTRSLEIESQAIVEGGIHMSEDQPVTEEKSAVGKKPFAEKPTVAEEKQLSEKSDIAADPNVSRAGRGEPAGSLTE